MSAPSALARSSTSLLSVLALASGVTAGPIAFVSSEVDLGADAEVSCLEDPGAPDPCLGDLTVTDSDTVQRSDVVNVDESVAANALLTAPPLQAAASASLQASVTDTSLVASSGTFGSFFEPGPLRGGSGAASVFYEVVFSVPSLVSYDFHIELATDTIFGTAFSRVALEDALGVPVFEFEWDPFECCVVGAFDAAGALAPGVYSLVAEASSYTFDGTSSSSFAVTGNFVPEPATGCLLAMGLAGIAVESRRSRRPPRRRPAGHFAGDIQR